MLVFGRVTSTLLGGSCMLFVSKRTVYEQWWLQKVLFNAPSGEPCSSSISESQCISSLAAKLLNKSSLIASEVSFTVALGCNHNLQPTCPASFMCPAVFFTSNVLNAFSLF